MKKFIYFIIVVAFYLVCYYYDDSSIKEEYKISSDGNLIIRYLDVGQADSILIENNSKFMLIDAGNNSDGDLLVDYFKKLGIKEFEYVVATHPHEDHIGGMDDVINNFSVKNFYMSDVVTTTKTFEDMIDAVENNVFKVSIPEIGDEFNFSDLYFKVLHVGDESYDDLNDVSICLSLGFGKNKFIFMGDASSKVEDMIIDRGYNITSDVLKVGHHGSSYSSSINFLKEVKPKYSIISVGEGNTYSHPHSQTISLLNKVNSEIYRTDLDGTIIVTSDGENIKVIKDEVCLNG